MKFGVFYNPMVPRARNIRLGSGIVHASHNDPVRVAERIATIDQVSGGRAEFGFGPGTPLEIGPFLNPPVNVIPKSFQDPHPPLWTSTSRPGMAAEVASPMNWPTSARGRASNSSASASPAARLPESVILAITCGTRSPISRLAAVTSAPEQAMESLEIWGTQIIPEFPEREAEHQAWRKKQLDGLNLPVVTSV
jgi:hypothetical protein